MLANRALLLAGASATYHVRIDMIALTIRVLASIAWLTLSALAQEPTPAQLADAIWIEGRVNVPDGTPKDEHLDVIADAIGIQAFDKHRVHVAADGTFRVAFAKGIRAGQLRLDGRFLYIEKEVYWHPGNPTSGIVLEPTLGGRLRVRVVVPPDADTGSKPPDHAHELAHDDKSAVIGVNMSLLGLSKSGGPMPPTLVARVSPDSTAELGPVRSGCVYHAELAAPPFVPQTSADVEVAPGTTTTLDLVLRLGATVRGRVLGEDGKPIAGAEIGAYSEGLDVFGPQMYGLQQKTGPDGTFEIRGIPTGELRLWAEAKGFLPEDSNLPPLRLGEVRENVVVRLLLGLTISGRVLDPEGKPAGNARIHCVRRGATDPVPEEEWDVVSASDGTFRITGMRDGGPPMNIHVSFERPAKGPQEKTRTYEAHLKDVEAGTRDLTVTLRALTAVEIRVSDDIGRPITRLTIGATRPTGPHVAQNPADHIERSLASADGTFQLEGLAPGAWDVYVYANGVAYVPAQRVDLPKDTAPLLFTLKRNSSVAGTVRDAAGAPVVGAIVTIHWQRPAILGGVETGEQTSVKSGKDGHFELSEVYPGKVLVSAKTADGATSAPLELVLAPGERRDAVEIVVRKP
jgi:hypothetical protein